MYQVRKDAGEKAAELKEVREKLSAIESQTRTDLASENAKSQQLLLQTETLQSRLSGQEGKISDLTEELSTLQRHYDEQCQANDELKSQLLEQEKSLEEALRHKSNK